MTLSEQTKFYSFQIKVANNDITSGTIPLTWCVDIETLKLINNIQTKYMIQQMKSGRDTTFLMFGKFNYSVSKVFLKNIFKEISNKATSEEEFKTLFKQSKDEALKIIRKYKINKNTISLFKYHDLQSSDSIEVDLETDVE